MRNVFARFDADELDKAKLDAAALRRAWSFAHPYRLRLVAYAGVILLSSLLGVLPPLVFKALVDLVTEEPRPDGIHGRINALFLAAIALALLMTAMGLVSRWSGSLIGEGLIHDLRVALFDKVQRMPLAFFSRTQTGALMSRLSNDVIGAQATVGTGAELLSNLLTLVTVLAAMLALSWRVTVLALLIVPVFLVLDRLMGRRLGAMSRRRMVLNADLSSTMTERFNVSGALLVKLFGRPAAESTAFAERTAAVRDTGVGIAVYSRLYYGLMALAGSLGTATVYWFGARGVQSGGITIGTLTALAAYVTRLYSPLTSLAGARVDLLAALVSFDRCFEVLDAPEAITDKPGAPPLHEPLGRVEVDRVSFRYPAPATVSIASLEAGSPETLSAEPSAEVLHDVSFRAAPGQTVALVGHSGAGKTTLASLLPRLYDVTAGAVRIDGRDVRDVTRQSVAEAVGVVSQEAHLFHDTIANNLRYARPGATDAELVDACRQARIHDLIASLPEGYDTVVGERGHRLSGGEKQRIAIARVLLKRPAVIILDEATAHLDAENEAHVQDALLAALAGRTAIVIAHRLSTVQHADAILVLDEGRVVERGTHAELLAEGGAYAALVDTQLAPTASA